MKEVFNGVQYLKDIALKNKTIAKEWTVTECAGVEGIQGIMEEYRKKQRFIMVDNTPVGSVTSNGSGFFNRRTYTAHIVIRTDQRRGLEDYDSKMSEVRNIYLQLLSRILHDYQVLTQEQVYLQYRNIYYKEPGPYGYGGSAGLYFMISIDQPQDLTYDNEQWEDTADQGGTDAV